MLHGLIVSLSRLLLANSVVALPTRFYQVLTASASGEHTDNRPNQNQIKKKMTKRTDTKYIDKLAERSVSCESIMGEWLST